jgi:hypothetical protein
MSQNPYVTISNRLGAQYGGRKIAIFKNKNANGDGESTGEPLHPWETRELPMESEPGEIKDLEIQVLGTPGNLEDGTEPPQPIPLTIQSPHQYEVRVVEKPAENKWQLIFIESDEDDSDSSNSRKIAVRKEEDEPKVNVGVGVGEPPLPVELSYKRTACTLIICIPASYMLSRFVLNLAPKWWPIVPIVSVAAGIIVWVRGWLKEKKNKTLQIDRGE